MHIFLDAFMALYGKYRPNTFADMVGQDAPKNTLLNTVKLGRLAHAYLFCGTRGTGKTSSARILAKAINCENITPSGDPCTQCSLCHLAEEGKLTDIIEIDAASNRGIDEIRDLREKVAFAPNTGKAKIYIIDEVHMLTKEAFNALLKTLEEPPSHAYFILATTEYHKVPETIRSRCQTFFFTNISPENIISRLEHICTEEGFEYDKEGLAVLAKRAAGGLRDAISLLEQSSSYGPITVENLRKSLGIISSDFLSQFLHSLQSCDSAQAFSQLEALQNEGRSLEEFGKDFLGYLRELFRQYIHEKNALLPWILEVIDIFEDALQKSKRFEIPPLALEMAIAKTMLTNKEFTSQLESISAPVVVSTQRSKPVIPAEQETVSTPSTVSPSAEKVQTAAVEVKKEEPVSSPMDDLMPPLPDEEFPTPSEPHKEKENEDKGGAQKEEKESSSFSSVDDLLPPWEEVPTAQSIPKTPETLAPVVAPVTPPVSSPSPVSPAPVNSGSATAEEDTFSHIVAHWKTICEVLPKSVKINLLQFGTPSSFSDGILSLSIEGEFTKTLLQKEKNKTAIEKALSDSLGREIAIAFVQNESSEESLSVSEVENLLQF